MFYGYGILNNHVPTLKATAMKGGINSSGKLLDTYPNAIGAYSLRKLRSAYTGYAVRVVRFPDQSSLDVGFDANGNFDINSVNTFLGSAIYASISIWYDQSGNGNNATQTTFDNQPYIRYIGVNNTLNGKIILSTNVANGLRCLQTPISNLQNRPISIITAGKISALATNTYENISFYIGGTSNAGGGGSRYEMSANDTILRSSIRDTSTSLAQSSFNTNPFIHQAHFGSTTLTGRFNGVDTSMAINDSGQFSTASNFVLMSAPSNIALFSPNIGMYETIFYLSDKTTDRAGIESNINAYYSIY
jgi:hypothetical protein